MHDMSEQTIDVTSDAVPKTYEDAVRVLATVHASGPDQVEIYHLPDPQQRVVRLIEVSEAFPQGGVERLTPTGAMERVVPVFPMGPANDFPFRSEIIQVTPAEWEELRQGSLKLNRNWGDLNLVKKVVYGN
jgi:hypothetical protein